MSKMKKLLVPHDKAVKNICGYVKKSAETTLAIAKELKAVKSQYDALVEQAVAFSELPKDERDSALEKLKKSNASVAAVLGNSPFNKTTIKATMKIELELMYDQLPFGYKVGDKFIQIAHIAEVIEKNLDIAPVSYSTLWKLRDLSEQSEWDAMRKAGLSSYSTSKEVTELLIKCFNEDDATPNGDASNDDSYVPKSKVSDLDASEINVSADDSVIMPDVVLEIAVVRSALDEETALKLQALIEEVNDVVTNAIEKNEFDESVVMYSSNPDVLADRYEEAA